jgi:hypothetical protein
MSTHMTNVVKAYVPTAERRSVSCGVRLFIVFYIQVLMKTLYSTAAATTTRSTTKATLLSASLPMVPMMQT